MTSQIEMIQMHSKSSEKSSNMMPNSVVGKKFSLTFLSQEKRPFLAYG